MTASGSAFCGAQCPEQGERRIRGGMEAGMKEQEVPAEGQSLIREAVLMISLPGGYLEVAGTEMSTCCV